MSALQKPDKLYLNNPNLVYALSPKDAAIGTLRETFFYHQLHALTHQGAVPAQLLLPKKGDFLFALPKQEYVFKIGGPNKEAKQIGTAPHHYVVVDAAVTNSASRFGCLGCCTEGKTYFPG